MDDKGFIFTADATLALVVVIVITASIVTYAGLPVFQGEDHQHLEALADSVLESMDQNGTLARDTALCSNNNTTIQQDGKNDLIENLNLLIPQGIGYKLTVGSLVIDSRDVDSAHNITLASDVATKVKVISGAQVGWVGRAYYKQEEVKFVDQNQTQTTTVWNFHNWLQNFQPWNGGLDDYPFWGGNYPGSYGSQQAVPITFNINGTINNATFLLGSADSGHREGWYNVQDAYGANFVLNGNSANHNIQSGDFTDLQYAASSGQMYNYLGQINGSELVSGMNNFYINFDAYSSQKMPWFSLLANYNTSIKVPQGILTDTSNFPNIAGVGMPSWEGQCINYDLATGQVTKTPGRSIDWTTLQTQDIDTSTPFELTGLPNGISQGSAVASVSNVYLPNSTRLFDAYTVVNAYGGEDGAIVQVKNAGGTWNTIFTSFGNTARSDGGYGNIPGILNIAPYITAGNNQVRIITWDDATNHDYDFVGLTNCYSTITYSQLPIRWDTFPFSSYQYSGTATQSQTFKIYNEAQEALLFVGTGLDTKSITVTVKKVGSSTTSQLYNGPVPYVLDLAQLDVNPSQTNHIITNGTDTNGTPILVPGNYTLTVTANTGKAYESGDFGGTYTSGSGTVPQNRLANGEIYSGTRISIIYPKFLQNVWSDGFAPDPETAKNAAKQKLKETLQTEGYNITDISQIKTEAIYTGDMPNAIPVRLELWKQ